jgi:cobalt-zinc-cadmium resistance protein CzcA
LDTKKLVTQVFYDFLILKEKEKLLQKADTLFSEFYSKSNLRLQKGENNILEKVTAESQKTAIQVQLNQLQSELEIIQLELQLALNTEEVLVPESTTLKLLILDSDLNKSLHLQLLEQQKNVAAAETSLQKAKLLPEINLGYNNNSFKGIGLDDSQRFHSAQLGLGIPLFGGSQKAKINASKIAQEIADSEFQTHQLKLKNQQKQLLSRYKSNLDVVSYFETTSNANSKIITTTAKKQFSNGDINYLDFVLLVNQSISIQNSYLESIKSLNEVVISLNYLN